MTTMLNGKAPADTVRDDVQMCVRAPENPPTAPETGDPAGKSAYTRAISRLRPSRLRSDAHNFASTELSEAKQAAAESWPLTEQPPAAMAMWQQVVPEPGEAPNVAAWVAMSAAGLFRACSIQILWLIAVALRTRKGSGVAFVITVFLAAIYAAAHLM